VRAQQAGFFMRAFGDGTRLRVVAALSHRPLRFGELGRVLRCPKERLARHLQYLHDRRVIESQRTGQTVVYRLADAQHALHRAALAAVLTSLGDIDEVEQDRSRMRGHTRGGGSKG